MTETPLVSCIMPVASTHSRFVGQAIDCWEAQTHQNTELVVLGQSRNTPRNAYEARDDMFPQRLRCYHYGEGFTLGELRNIACGFAKGEVIAHWDVDDWSDPERIEFQLGLLSGAQVVGFHTMLFWDQRTQEAWRFSGPQHVNLGTSLMYRREWWEQRKFAPKNAAEDRAFINSAVSEGVYLSCGAGELMVARSHANNTCPRNYNGPEWTQAAVSDLPPAFRAIEGM